MKNGFVKGLLLGVGLCLLTVVGFGVGFGIKEYKKAAERVSIGLGTPSPAPIASIGQGSITGEVAAVTSTPAVTATPTETPPASISDVTLTPSLSPTPTPIMDPLTSSGLVDQFMVDKIDFLGKIIYNYYYKDVSVSDIEEGIYKGLMNGVGDPYTVYYTPEEYTAMLEDSTGQYGGVGAYITLTEDRQYACFLNPFEDSPAEKAGIQSYDIIYKVNDEVVLGETTEYIASKVRGEIGTTVNLTLYRPSTQEYLDFQVVRAKIASPTVSTEILEGNVGYIKISEFATVTKDQFIKAVDDLTEQGVKGFIIDLRNNGGGDFDACIKMADYLMPQTDLITYTLDKAGEGQMFCSEDNHHTDLPIAILINGNSASASEVFTGALKDNGWATVIGTRSFGKGIVQAVLPITDGSAVKVTISSYYNPSGVCVQGTGITPDIVVEYTENDNQKAAALEYILGEIK